jgi:hypothetical protein
MNDRIEDPTAASPRREFLELVARFGFNAAVLATVAAPAASFAQRADAAGATDA